MAYSVVDDLQKHVDGDTLIQLTDDEASGTINQARVDDAIADADATIDGYLARRYAVPVSPVPALVTHLSVDIALYNLFCRRPGTMPEERKNRYDDAMRQLGDLSKGVSLLAAPAAPAGLTDEAQTVTSAGTFVASVRTGESDPWSGY